jgi:glycerol uptake facilitator-like aquaporin
MTCSVRRQASPGTWAVGTSDLPAPAEPIEGGDDARAGVDSRRPPLSSAVCECVLTMALLFIVASGLRWFRDPASGVYITSLRPALAVLAAITAVVLAGLIVSPLGRRSGGHMNPAVTVAVWLMDVFPGASVVPYVAAQLAGSVAGVGLARLVWGPSISTKAINYAALGPKPGVNAPAVYLGECGCMIALTVMVGFFLAYPTYNRWLPGAIALAVASVIFLLGPVTGGVVNPARQFGPAVLANQGTDLWIYLTAPIVGAALGAGLHHLLYRRFKTRQPLTYKLAGSRSPTNRARGNANPSASPLHFAKFALVPVYTSHQPPSGQTSGRTFSIGSTA